MSESQPSPMSRRSKVRRQVLAAILLIGSLSCRADDSPGNVPPRKDYAKIVEALRPFIEREMADKGLPGLSIAIVDDQQTLDPMGLD